MKRVGILRGGTDENYEKSLKDGGDLMAYIAEHLADSCKVVDILVDQEGVWHMGGLPIQPSQLSHRVDAVWNLSHPSFSNTLDSFAIRNSRLSPFASLVGHSRAMLEAQMKKSGVKLPRHLIVSSYYEHFDGDRDKFIIRKATEVHAKFGTPWLVKSFPENSDVGVHVAKTFDELVGALDDTLRNGQSAMVEELIIGKNTEVHAVPLFRGDDIYTFPISGVTSTEKEKIASAAQNLHEHLGENSYLNINLVVHPRLGIYLTGINFLPDLTPESSFCRSCESIGAKAPQVVRHLLEQI